MPLPTAGTDDFAASVFGCGFAAGAGSGAGAGIFFFLDIKKTVSGFWFQGFWFTRFVVDIGFGNFKKQVFDKSGFRFQAKVSYAWFMFKKKPREVPLNLKP